MTSKRRVYIEAEIDEGKTLQSVQLSLASKDTLGFAKVGPLQIIAVGDLAKVKRQWIREHLHRQLDALNEMTEAVAKQP